MCSSSLAKWEHWAAVAAGFAGAEVLTDNAIRRRGVLNQDREPDQGELALPSVPAELDHRLDIPRAIGTPEDWKSWFPVGRCPSQAISFTERGEGIYRAWD